MSNPTLPSPTPTVANAFQQPPVLTQIQTKVRRLTRSPSTAQLTDADLNNYINTYVVYDFPEQLRTFNLRTQFTFFTNPGQDVYPTDITSFLGVTTNQLYNFQNLYITVHPPVYIAGFPVFFSQDRQQFYGVYPFLNNISSIGITGNGTSGPFTGVINSQQSIVPPGITQQISLLQNQVLFSSIGTTGNGLSLADVPVYDPTTGNPTVNGNLYDPSSAAYQAALRTPPTVITPGNTINYLTGAFTINFSAATATGMPINSQTVPLALSRPQALLFYQNEFVVRPVPDQSYRVNFEVYQRPTALLASGQSPELEEYWQMIAYSVSKKIFEDRMDMDSVQLILPALNEQLRLCLRRTIVQLTNERVATIYTQQSGFGSTGGWGWGGGYGSF